MSLFLSSELNHSQFRKRLHMDDDEICFKTVDAWTMAVVITGVCTYASPRELSDAIWLKFKSDCGVVIDPQTLLMKVAFYIRARSGYEIEHIVNIPEEFQGLISELDLTECPME